MNNILLYLNLFKEFFLIGVFSFGGGYATIPFLYDISQRYGWYTVSELSQITAVASITPGPVGINAATYAGMKVQGILTAALATSAEIIPALIIVIFVSKLLKKFSDNPYVKAILYALRPVSCALLAFAALQMLKSIIRYEPKTFILLIVLFVILLIICFKTKKSPLWYISVSALYGFILELFM